MLRRKFEQRFGHNGHEAQKALDYCYELISQVSHDFASGFGMDDDLDLRRVNSTLNAIQGCINLIKRRYLSSISDE